MTTEATGRPRRYLGVAGLQQKLSGLLEKATSARPFKIRAQVSGMKDRTSGTYCDLIETDAGKVIAKVRCFIHRDSIARMNRKLRAAGLDGMLQSGNEVALEIQVQYHAVYGLSVVASDIDVDASLGELERRRRALKAALERDGLVGRNAALVVPLVPLRIGLIASRGTAAFEDFVQTLRASGFAFRMVHADARVQGEDVERSVLRALARLRGCDVELVVLVRGGGSPLELAQLDNEAIARAIAGFPKPVWIGIGHETDESVLDAVAARHFKTPTAVAAELVGRAQLARERLMVAARRIRSAAGVRLGPERRGMNAHVDALRSAVQHSLRRRVDAHAGLRERLHRATLARTAQERRVLRHRGAALATRPATLVASVRHKLLEHQKSLTKTSTRALRRADESRHRDRERLLSGRIAARIEGEQFHLRAKDDRVRQHLFEVLRFRREEIARWTSGTRAAASRLRLQQDRLAASATKLLARSDHVLGLEAERHGGRSRHLRTVANRTRAEAVLLARRTADLEKQAARGHARIARAQLAWRNALRAARARILRRLTDAHRSLESQRAMVDAVDPGRVLVRGFSLIYDSNGKLVRQPDDVRPGDAIRAVLAAGELYGRVDRTTRGTDDE